MKAYERLMAYTKFEASSREANPCCPSTPEQLVFGRALVEEMLALGIKDASMDENGYVFGTIPANIEGWKGETVGFIAHVDVVDDVKHTDMRPRFVENYEGGDIELSPGIMLSPADYPFMKGLAGHDLVVTDGKTLLGADDRAGIAEIMTMAEMLLADDSIKHGEIKIGFTPDEEIGRGADLFDIEKFGAKYAYTVDGGPAGSINYETFNAAAAEITVNGRSIHPGSAKNKMINAMLVAMEFNSLLPALEKPQYTENYEGFYHITHMAGNVEKATLNYILRDHDIKKLEERKAVVMKAAAELNARYREGTVTCTIKDSYRNMSEIIEKNMSILVLI